MLLLVVRHAQAGSRDAWQGDDAVRPLTGEGVEQAAGLADLLAPYGARRVVSSPRVRCVQTVQPFARRTGLPVEVSAALEPTAGARAGAFVRRLAMERGPLVVCTHGETIEALDRHLPVAGSTFFVSGAGPEKGSVWVLEVLGGIVVSAQYLPPPCVGEHLVPSAPQH